MQCPVCNASNAATAKSCKSCGTRLDADSAASDAHVLPAGVALREGQYTVGKVLGQGGFGITYQGSEQALRRSIAIKEFFPQGCIRRGTTVSRSGGISEADYTVSKQRFLEEAQTLARFEHPNIVRVHACFEENASAYMVMELLNGSSLGAILEQQVRLKEADALRYIREVGDGLSTVHAANLLHRDIKPDNVMVLKNGRAVLVDFGSARAFATGKTKHMTRLVTEGYAPFEQYCQEAHFGAFTDVYALGATLYHLLTGRLPVPAPDRAQGVALKAPSKIVPDITPAVSDAVLWAMQMKALDRPQSVSEFMQALAGAKVPPSGGGSGRKTGGRSVPAPPPPRNPYETRIGQITAELSKPVGSAPRGALDTSIQSIENELRALASSLPANPEQCPGCRRGNMVKHTGQVTGLCPLCKETKLVQRALNEGRCAVCRGGNLAISVLSQQESFCPICHNAVMKCERRKHFGVALDLWWVCPHCKAEIDVFTGGKAKLMTFGEDPHGTGATHVGQVLPTLEWRKLAGRADTYFECERCNAQFEAPDEGRLKLVAAPNDAQGVGRKYLGKTFLKIAWAKIFAGLPLTAGNLYCPKCSAEFDHEQSGSERTLKCLALGANPKNWPDEWRTRKFPIQTWYLAVSGKPSLRPGLLCAACATEFDLKNGQHELVATTAPDLRRHKGECHSLDDWHRLARSLPSLTREDQLRKEMERLRALKRKEETQWTKNQENQRAALQAELDQLLKKAFLSGTFPLQLVEKRAGLRPTERLLWESPALKLKMRTNQGYQYYESDQIGTLLITSERVVFVSDYGQVWQRKFGKLAAVEMAYSGKQRVMLAWFTDLQKPVPLVVTDSTMTVTISGRACPLKIGMDDLVTLLRSRI